MANVAGGYGPFQPVDDKTREILKKAAPIGVGYEPFIVSTQVVSGTNYLYMCNATVVYPGATPYPVQVIVYQPLKGDPHVTSISHVP